MMTNPESCCRKREGTYPSSDAVSAIHYVIYEPTGDILPTAIVQIAHGMAEYIGRYEKEGMIPALVKAGFVVCGNDHVGHGSSAADEKDLGHFTDYRNLVDDLHTLNGIVRKTYPSLPYVLFGHSMGSFVVRSYITKYRDIDGAVICGTSAGNQPLKLGIAVCSLFRLFIGARGHSRLLDNMMFSGYNKNFSGEKDPLSWLSGDAELRERYRQDRLCGFSFTVSGIREMLKMLREISSVKEEEAWACHVPLSLPVLLVSGEEDPLGENGEGVKEVYARLEDAELNELQMKLYPHGRHEIMNDTMKDAFFDDMIAWVKKVSEGVIACRSYNGVTFGHL